LHCSVVEEGDEVQAEQVVAKLDTRVQELQLEIATQQASTTSQLTAAQQAFEKRQTIAARLSQLKARGHASQSEIIRSEMELSIAQAKMLAAQEEQAVRQIERRRAKVQLDRRTIVSPFNGVVSKVHAREGEFLSPLHPEVVTIIQVDKLLATFAIPSSQIKEFAVGKEFNLEMENGTTIVAEVYRVGVSTDAQSGTVEVKMEIENSQRDIRSGEILTLNI